MWNIAVENEEIVLSLSVEDQAASTALAAAAQAEAAKEVVLEKETEIIGIKQEIDLTAEIISQQAEQVATDTETVIQKASQVATDTQTVTDKTEQVLAAMEDVSTKSSQVATDRQAVEELADQTALDRIATGEDRDYLESFLFHYISDDEISVRIGIGTQVLVSESTTGYPSVILELSTP
jgi:hypothetical protein